MSYLACCCICGICCTGCICWGGGFMKNWLGAYGSVLITPGGGRAYWYVLDITCGFIQHGRVQPGAHITLCTQQEFMQPGGQTITLRQQLFMHPGGHIALPIIIPAPIIPAPIIIPTSAPTISAYRSPRPIKPNMIWGVNIKSNIHVMNG